MRSEQSLRDAYAELTASAPSTEELLRSLPPAARRPATRWQVMAAAAAVAVLATGAGLIVRDFAGDGSTGPAAPTVVSTPAVQTTPSPAVTAVNTTAPTAVKTTAPTTSASAPVAAAGTPGPLRFRFAVSSNATWSASLNEISSPTEQVASVELTADPTVGGTVAVRPNGSYPELKPTTGEPVTVNGQTTGYLFAQKASGSGVSRLIWPYSGQGWASIQVDFKHALTAADRAKIMTLAEHVVPTSGSLPRAPFRLGYLPLGLTPVSYLAVGSGISVDFIDAAGSALQVVLEPEGAHGCSSQPADGRYESSLVLAGHTGCRISVDGPDGPPVELRLDVPGGILIVRVVTDPSDHVGTYSEEDLTRILADAVLIGTPNDSSSWGELTF